jgi:hypothetical protein
MLRPIIPVGGRFVVGGRAAGAENEPDPPKPPCPEPDA